ncbi:MAG: hypothetical protein U9N14_02095, partial [Pseudomonadota bacterium]|nr:hypothetical protein [Pseudomonadota bacterium]
NEAMLADTKYQNMPPDTMNDTIQLLADVGLPLDGFSSRFEMTDLFARNPDGDEEAFALDMAAFEIGMSDLNGNAARLYLDIGIDGMDAEPANDASRFLPHNIDLAIEVNNIPSTAIANQLFMSIPMFKSYGQMMGPLGYMAAGQTMAQTILTEIATAKTTAYIEKLAFESDAFSFGLSGQASMEPGEPPKPSLNLELEITGLSDMIASKNDAPIPDDVVQRLIETGELTANNGELRFHITLDEEGQVIINGQPLLPILNRQTPSAIPVFDQIQP